MNLTLSSRMPNNELEDCFSEYPRIIFDGREPNGEIIFTWQMDEGQPSYEWELLGNRQCEKILSHQVWNVWQYITVANGVCEFEIGANSARTTIKIPHGNCIDAFNEAARLTRYYCRVRNNEGQV